MRAVRARARRSAAAEAALQAPRSFVVELYFWLSRNATCSAIVAEGMAAVQKSHRGFQGPHLNKLRKGQL